MNASYAVQCVVAIIAVATWFCFSAFAAPVYTYGGGFDLAIPGPDDPDSQYGRGWMDDAVIEISDHFTIYDLDVVISLTHSKAFDLQIFLHSPAGTYTCLNMYDLDEYFDGEDYVATIFDDEADIPIELGQPPFTGRFTPESSLSVFDGEDTYGLWRLQIYDAYYADTGNLDSFQLMITVLEPATAVLFILGVALFTLLRPRR